MGAPKVVNLARAQGGFQGDISMANRSAISGAQTQGTVSDCINNQPPFFEVYWYTTQIVILGMIYWLVVDLPL